MRKGIVGHAADKFTSLTELVSKTIMDQILNPGDILVSGGCHLDGIDIWAEDIAKRKGCYDPDYIHLPARHRWSGGYKERNLLIAKDSEIVHVIVVKDYPPHYIGMRFSYCYHCNSTTHIKSGACWTARKALSLYNTPAIWYVISLDGNHKVFKEEG